MNVLPPGATAHVLVLRSLIVLLPCAAVALALPERPDGLGVVLVVASSAWWARQPDHLTGAISLAAVAALGVMALMVATMRLTQPEDG